MNPRFTFIVAVFTSWVPLGASAFDFKRDIAPFIAKHCADCHYEATSEGDFSFHAATGDMKSKVNARLWEKVFTQLSLHQMPPEEETQPDEAERTKVVQWIATELAHVGVRVEDKRQRPGYGNHVQHEILFGDAEVAASFSPPRVWRVRPEVYEDRLQGVAKNNYVAPFNLKSGGHGFRDYDNQYVISGADLNQLLANTKKAAAALTEIKIEDGKPTRGSRSPQQLFSLIDPAQKEPATDEQLTTATVWLYNRVLLREPTANEKQRVIEFARRSMQSDGRLLGVRNMISAVLLNPESLYRSEAGGGETDEFGRVMLAPREIAYSISYALTDARPNGELLKAADAGNLSTREEVKQQVERLLENERLNKPRILGFFREYFEYGAAIDVFKDEALFRSHSPETLVRDTDQLVMHIYEQDEDVFRRLLTTRKSFVQYLPQKDGAEKAPGKGQGAHLAYNLPLDWKWIPDQPIELPGDQRAGILTQPSWLVAKSGNFDNDAIRRGLWVRNKLLGGTILDIPITVDAQLPDDETLTLRQRMKVTEAEYCWKCHRQTNPVGLPFEMYDHFGRWRTRELGKPVDTSGEINRSGDPSLNAPVKDSIELVHKLADSDRVRQVFIRHAFRYWMGRNEGPHDAATLRRADRVYLESGGSMKALIVSLLTSDSFLYRKEP